MIELIAELACRVPLGLAEPGDDDDPAHLLDQGHGIGHDEGWRRVYHDQVVVPLGFQIRFLMRCDSRSRPGSGAPARPG